MGHALFDVLDIPVMGQPEHAADQFAAYMMLHLGKDCLPSGPVGRIELIL
jgi:hypothetical protein